MVDSNNKGDAIHIPSHLISKEDGDIIKEHIEKADDVMILVSLDISNDRNEVYYEIWYAGPFDFLHFDLDALRKVYLTLADTALFYQNIYTYSCVNCSEEVLN